MGDLPYSASFYAQGKVKALPQQSALAELLVSTKTPFFIALNPDQVATLPVEMQATLQLVAASGAYKLFRSASK